MSDEFADARCGGCRRQIGVGRRVNYRLYCNVMCARDYAPWPTEDRDALIETIVQTGRGSRKDMAPMFGISRQRVEQILNRRLPG